MRNRHLRAAMFLCVSGAALAQPINRPSGGNSNGSQVLQEGPIIVGNGRQAEIRSPVISIPATGIEEARSRYLNADATVMKLMEKQKLEKNHFVKGISNELEKRLSELPSPGTKMLATTEAPAIIAIRPAWRGRCDADWNQRCKGEAIYTPSLPEMYVPTQDGGVKLVKSGTKFDICRFTLKEISKNHGHWILRKASPTGIVVYLESWGSNLIIDRWRGWVEVDLRVVLIEAIASDERRQQAKCSYSNATDGSDGQGLKEYLMCVSNPGGGDARFGVQMCGDFIFENGKKKMIKGPYVCGVCANYKNPR